MQRFSYILNPINAKKKPKNNSRYLVSDCNKNIFDFLHVTNECIFSYMNFFELKYIFPP